MTKPIAHLYCLKYAALALPLAFAGLPVYVHVPKFYAEVMQVNLASLGILLFCLRLADSVMDPLIGVISDRLARFRRVVMLVAMPLLAAGYFLLFAPPDLAAQRPLVWLGACLFLVYFAFSALMINYYALGLELSQGYHDNTRISAWREGFMLLGVLAASLLPALLTHYYPLKTAYALFAFMLVPLLGVCGFITLKGYSPSVNLAGVGVSFAALLASRTVRRLLLLAFFNAIPAAITSTLFMFFVMDVLQAENQGGLMLAVYFLSAAGAAPLWSVISGKTGKRKALLAAMILAVACFVWAWQLHAHAILHFYIICVLSGFTMGADIVLMPALFADSLSGRHDVGATAFGLWNLTSKLTMAVAAGISLPLLSVYGYHTGGINSQESLAALSFCYAIVPCLFKLGAAFFLYHFIPEQRYETP